MDDQTVRPPRPGRERKPSKGQVALRRGVAAALLLGFFGLAAWLGVSALALAIVLPMVVPHLPTTFLADGLGRAEGSRGGGAVSLNTTVDLRRSLENQSQAPVVTYSTTTSTPAICGRARCSRMKIAARMVTTSGDVPRASG